MKQLFAYSKNEGSRAQTKMDLEHTHLWKQQAISFRRADDEHLHGFIQLFPRIKLVRNAPESHKSR